MTRAFKSNQTKSLSWQAANDILSDFDSEKHDKIIDAKSGEIFIFYSLDEDKVRLLCWWLLTESSKTLTIHNNENDKDATSSGESLSEIADTKDSGGLWIKK